MKYLFWVCGLLLFLATANLPIGFYTFLRIVVSVVSILAIVDSNNRNNGLFTVLFGILLIIFNPLIPVYLQNKDYWMPIDVISGLLCFVYGLLMPKQLEE